MSEPSARNVNMLHSDCTWFYSHTTPTTIPSCCLFRGVHLTSHASEFAYSVTGFPKILPFVRMWQKHGASGQATDDNTIRRMRLTC